MGFRAHAVTFDCWQTLIYDDSSWHQSPRHGRVDILAEVTGAPRELVAQHLTAGWTEHQRAWHRREVFAGKEITHYVLNALNMTLPQERFVALVRTLEDEIAGHDIKAVDGAREILQTLHRADMRVALVCDTGFSPGRVVRELLARVGLLDLLEVHIFSDEVGAPKPHPRPFQAALDGLGVRAQDAIHVGDLRRSDIAGAKAMGMGSVRFTGRNDDSDSADGAAGAGIIDCVAAGCSPQCARPEADIVVPTYTALEAWLQAKPGRFAHE